MLSITTNEFKLLAAYIKSNYGIHLKDEKRVLLIGRLQQILASKNLRSFNEYYEYLLADQTGEAVNVFINKITTNHTFFMREAEHFQYLKQQVLPNLIPELKDRDLRIWSAGCSSGEEPYTMSMILDEFFGAHHSGWDTKVLATDISNHVLEKAVKGVYSVEDIASLPLAWQKKYFRLGDSEGSVIVRDTIKNNIIFGRFNLMEPVFRFKKPFHVIFCRNVMIYFDQETKNALAKKFYDLLAPGGYLFIGHSETLPRETTPFQYIMPAVYRKGKGGI